MKITLDIDDRTLAKAKELTGVTDVSTLAEMGLKALIVRESAACLAELAGSEKGLEGIPRRRLDRRPYLG